MKTFLIALSLAVALSGSLVAQTATPVYLNNTTLSAAVNTTQTTISVASVAAFTSVSQAIAVGQELFVDLEAMTVLSISGTTLTVRRGVDGTRAMSHASGATVLSGPSNAFQQADPPYGSCTTATQIVVPWVNVSNGNVWLCRASVWKATNIQPITFNSLTPYCLGTGTCS